MHYRIVILCVGLYGSALRAMPVSDTPRPGIRLLYDNLRIQQPGKDYTQRRSYNVSFHLPFRHNYRSDIFLMLAPDTVQKSRSVDIRQHYYGFFVGASLVKAWLLRYSLTAGPGVWSKKTESNILGESRSFNSNALCLFTRAAIDYAPSEPLEVSMTLSFFYQIPRKTLEWSYGFGFNINI